MSYEKWGDRTVTEDTGLIAEGLSDIETELIVIRETLSRIERLFKYAFGDPDEEQEGATNEARQD